MRRRKVLAGLGMGAAGILIAPRGLAAGKRQVDPIRLDDLARRIRATPHDEVFDLAVDAIGRGATPQVLLGAAFVAGVHDVEPRPVGNKLHSVMLIESSFRLVDHATDPRDAWLHAFWALDAFKQTQEETGEPWVLGPAPKVRYPNEAAARRELIAALESFDEERADRAIVGLLPYHDRASLYEILWPYCARSLAYLGHKIVYGAMTEAVLRRIDWRFAEPTARSLVYGLVGEGRGDPLIRSFELARELAPKLPGGWQDGDDADPERSAVLEETLLRSDYAPAQQAVIAAFEEGWGTRTVWDAIRLGASDVFGRRLDDDPHSGEAIRAVHAVTELWSMGYAWRTARDETTRRQLMLQAAGWLVEMRDALLVREAISMKRPKLLELGTQSDTTPESLDVLVERDDPAAARRWLDRHPQQADAFLARMRSAVAPAGVEYHQFKYAVAIEDEAAECHPRWASRILAPGLGYMPTERSAATELTKRTDAALRRAGIS